MSSFKLYHNRTHYQTKALIIILLVTLIIKCCLAAYLPLTGDEAYFAVWGKIFHWGYYDHTPLVGWILHVMYMLGNSNFILRLPTIFVTTSMGILLYAFLRPYYPGKAAPIAILYLISPINLCGVFITTDVPLIFFSFLSGLFLHHAIKKNNCLPSFLMAGLCLGLAFFSKYFAVLLGLAYLVYFLFSKKSWKRTFGFLLLFTAVLPFGLQNLYWNYTHAWANILFNVYTRNVGVHLEWHTLLLYIAILFYIITPPIFYYLIKHWHKLFRSPTPKTFSVFAVSFLVPLTFFLLLSTIKSIGLHWPLSFIPFVYLMMAAYLSLQEVHKCIKFMFWFSAIHLVLFAAILCTPVTAWQRVGIRGNHYANLVFVLKHKVVRHQLDVYNESHIIASPSYAKAVLMYIDSNIYSPTFGHGSVHGREGDFLTDFRTMKHNDFAILDTKKPTLKNYQPYFNSVSVRTFTVDDATFYVVLGDNFHYEHYRDTILRHINNRYWKIPKYLPHTKSFYCEKYFKKTGCKSHLFRW